MRITDFAIAVTLKEGKKKSLSIAQIMEVLKVTNKLLEGALYAIVRKL